MRTYSYLLQDMRESGGLKEEFDTVSCRHCRGAVKVFRAPYIHQHMAECYIDGCDHEQYYDPVCDGMLCRWCGQKLHETGAHTTYRGEAEKRLAKANGDRMLARL